MVTKFYTFTALFEKDPGTKSTYMVRVPAPKGCHTFGNSRAEAESMIQEAIELVLEALIDMGKPIPANKFVEAKKPSEYTKDIVVGVKQEVMAGYPVYETSRFAAS